MKENRERLAWTVLLVALGILLAILVLVPFGVYQWVQRATVAPQMVLQALQGAAQVEQPGEKPRLVLAGQEPIEIKPGATIWNDADVETLLTISSPDGTRSLGTVQIYPNTQLDISLARSPRYGLSKAEHRIEVTVETGRVRLGLARDTDSERATDFRGRTPHAQFLLWEAGSYSLEVDDQQTQITVREGKATIFVSKDKQLGLEAKQRGIVGVDGTIDGPLRPERDLITNGAFHLPLDDDWEIRADTTDSSQSAGKVELVISSGQEAVRLSRVGTGHAQTGVYQLLNESLNGYQSLQLHLSAQLNDQSLGICGVEGSECPLMVRIDYLDAAGSLHDWVQGFYYRVDAPDSYPTLCRLCPPPRQEHELHRQGTQFFYDSPNLMELLAQNGYPPSGIVSIGVYASGHSYDVQVSEIELLVEE